jgi:hypothetical protein
MLETMERKRMLRKSDFEMLISLRDEMLTQDTDAQASPRYWVVRDYRWEETKKGHHGRVCVYLPRQYDTYEIMDYLDNIRFHYAGIPENTLEELSTIMEVAPDLEEDERNSMYLQWIREYIDDDAELVYEVNIPRIVTSTFFLTKREAQEHIKANHYHYSDKVHTYAMTAWRSPQVQMLYSILETTDWETIGRYVDFFEKENDVPF